METRLNSLIYPIFGFIRSEFNDVEQMLVGEFRSGQQVTVGKEEWKILIRKECSKFTHNTDCLDAILSCRSKIDSCSSIKVNYNFQLMAWEQGAKNYIYNGSPVAHYTEKLPFWGPTKLLKWEEMLNGGYVKDGKIVVECAFRIDSEVGIPRRSIDFTEERPNTKDIEMICGVEDVMKSKRIEEIMDVSKIEKTGIFTEIYFINGVPFNFLLCKRRNKENIDGLAIYMYMNSDDQSEWWKCEVEAVFSVCGQNTKDDCKIKNFNWLFRNRSNASGNNELIGWNELVDPKNGYIKDGKIFIQVPVQISSQSGFDKKAGQGYVQPMKKMTDAVLKVGNKRFHVSKTILAQQSSYFSDLFLRDEKSDEYEMTDLEGDIFNKFLNLVYNQEFTLRENEIENVLKLAEKYGAPEVIERCDAVLKRMELIDTMKMLELVDKYNLPELRRRFLLHLKDEKNFKKVVNDPRYKTLNDSLKVAILEWKLVPEELQTEEKEETDYQFNTDFKLKSEFTDVEITVEGYKYHASKQILANASVFFMKRFYGPSSSDESQIKMFQVSPLQFETLLTHIYHPTRPVTCASLDSLLSLSKQFSVHRLTDKCEEYLILNDTLPLIRKLEYAGKYELPFLLSACLKHTDVKSLAERIGLLPAYVTDAVLRSVTIELRLNKGVISSTPPIPFVADHE